LGATVAILIVLVVTQLVTIFGFVMMERRHPAATLAWLFAIIFLPFLGVILYVLLGMTKLGIHERRASSIAKHVDKAIERVALTANLVDEEEPLIADYRTRALIRLGRSLSRTSASVGNDCQLLVNAAATYRAIIASINRATDHVHVQFYIIQPDQTGQNLRDRLVSRARSGIEVRVLYDAVGSMRLPRDFWAPLVEAGGEVAAFGPVPRALFRLRRRDRIDFRNHRKIVVVDGRVGFTGGINVGREYLGLNPDIGHWRDTHIELKGPAVLSLQKTFLEDWLRTTGKLLDDARYFPSPSDRSEGNSVVQIVDSGPDRTFSPIFHLYFSAMNMAQQRLWITSPYFVPDASIEETLVAAALRGVDVRILLPAKSDYPLISLAARSYYPKLLDAGVKIYEYGRGFVHAKTLVIDDWVGSVGSANMDIRSFHLNFEVNAFVFGSAFCRQLANNFVTDLRQSDLLSPESTSKLSYWKRLTRASARLLSPLL